MQIFLDQHACEMTVNSVGEAIAGAAALAGEDGRMIVDIYVDGDRWTEEDLSESTRVEAEAGEVRLVSADRGELARDVFADAGIALDEAARLQASAAELLQSDQAAAAMPQLETAISIWMSVTRAVELGSSVSNADLASLPVGDEVASVVISQLADRLRDLFGAMESQDHVRLADILLYEMTPIVERWQALLVTLQQRVK